MIFNAPFTRVKVDPLTAAPFAVAAATVNARPGGAACTEFAATVPAMIAVVNVTPRFRKYFRSFSRPRATRFVRVSRFVHFQRRGDFPRGFIFKKSQHHRVAVGSSPSCPSPHPAVARFVSMPPPVRSRWIAYKLSCSRFCRRISPFTKFAAVSLRLFDTASRTTPSRVATLPPCAPNDEDRLGDFFRVMWIAGKNAAQWNKLGSHGATRARGKKPSRIAHRQIPPAIGHRPVRSSTDKMSANPKTGQTIFDYFRRGRRLPTIPP